MILIPLIIVKESKYEHIIGTDKHDCLYIDQEDKGIQYLNLQCYEGTKEYEKESDAKFLTQSTEYNQYQHTYHDIYMVNKNTYEYMTENFGGTQLEGVLIEELHKYLEKLEKEKVDKC